MKSRFTIYFILSFCLPLCASAPLFLENQADGKHVQVNFGVDVSLPYPLTVNIPYNSPLPGISKTLDTLFHEQKDITPSLLIRISCRQGGTPVINLKPTRGHEKKPSNNVLIKDYTIFNPYYEPAKRHSLPTPPRQQLTFNQQPSPFSAPFYSYGAATPPFQPSSYQVSLHPQTVYPSMNTTLPSQQPHYYTAPAALPALPTPPFLPPTPPVQYPPLLNPLIVSYVAVNSTLQPSSYQAPLHPQTVSYPTVNALPQYYPPIPTPVPNPSYAIRKPYHATTPQQQLTQNRASNSFAQQEKHFNTQKQIVTAFDIQTEMISLKEKLQAFQIELAAIHSLSESNHTNERKRTLSTEMNTIKRRLIELSKRSLDCKTGTNDAAPLITPSTELNHLAKVVAIHETSSSKLTLSTTASHQPVEQIPTTVQPALLVANNNSKIKEGQDGARIQETRRIIEKYLASLNHELEETRKVQEDQERKAKEEEQERKVQEDQERKAKEEEQERKARVEQERKAKAEQERKARVEQERKAKAEQERKARVEQERKAKAEQERKARVEQERKAKAEEQEQERKVKAEQERKAKEDEQKRIARAEQERKAREEQERKAREEQEKLREKILREYKIHADNGHFNSIKKTTLISEPEWNDYRLQSAINCLKKDSVRKNDKHIFEAKDFLKQLIADKNAPEADRTKVYNALMNTNKEALMELARENAPTFDITEKPGHQEATLSNPK